MSAGVIIHIAVGSESRTEYFSDDIIRIGSDENCDLRINTDAVEHTSVWLTLENSSGIYRVSDFDPELHLIKGDKPIRRYSAITDGDAIFLKDAPISISFFSLTSHSSLITTRREQPHIAQFIEEAALESSITPKRDDAKVFLREFVRELSREISWTTKATFLILLCGFISGALYLGFALYSEIRKSRKESEEQGKIITALNEKLSQTTNQIGEIDKTDRDLMKTVSLAQNLRVEYGSGICLIVGVYDVIDKNSGKILRYPDPDLVAGGPYEPAPMEDQVPAELPPQTSSLTTEGNGMPLEYDFIGTGFHVGNGFVVTNRHVVQPWEEDDTIKQMIASSNGRTRIKRLVLYFPKYAQQFTVKIKQLSYNEDLAVVQIDAATLPTDIPTLPLETDTDSVAVGKTVVTMGYPSGPDRLLAMVDDETAKSINQKFGNSRQNLIHYLAQSLKIVPLTTQGAITDLDSKRIVHDAKTAEGGSGASLFGQSGKVVGVNFGGVFTENTAANMAVPIKYAIDILHKAGWLAPGEVPQSSPSQSPTPN